MDINQPDIDKFLAILTDSPRKIVTCTASASEGTLHESPGRRQLSAAETLARIRACQELHAFNIYAILAGGQPALPLIDERKWVKIRDYLAFPFNDVFQAFVLQRVELIHVLRSLSFEDWSRSTAINGRMETIFSQVRRLAFQELEYVEQIEILFQCKSE